MPATARKPAAGIIHKQRAFEIKARDPVDGSADDFGGFEGMGAIFLNLDHNGDIIAPGAFKEYLPEFLDSGFIGGMNHNWDEPVGHPVEAREQGTQGLFLKAAFDSTPDAQNIRAKMRPNPASGRATIRKLSIGYSIVKASRFPKADDVHSYWNSQNYTPSDSDLQLLDRFYTARRMKDGSMKVPGVQLLENLALHEVSPVAAPANDLAAVGGVKAAGLSVASETGPLGDIDESLVYGCMWRLHDMLCMALYSILGNELVPFAEKISLIGQACDQFRSALVDIVTFFLADEDTEETPAEEIGDTIGETVEQMRRNFASRFKIAEYDSSPPITTIIGAETAPFEDHIRTVASAVRGSVKRVKARHEVRQRDKRDLSDSHRKAIADLRETLVSGVEFLSALDSKPAPVPQTNATPETKSETAPATKGADDSPADFLASFRTDFMRKNVSTD